MKDKINVPIFAIVAFGCFVVLATLLVGLLPPLVNKPECESKKIAEFEQRQSFNLKENTSSLIANVHKRLAKKEQIKYEPSKINNDIINESNVLKTRFRRDTRNILERSKNINFDNEKRKTFFKQKVANSYENLTFCPEIEKPIEGVQYPWYSNRLPTYVIPTMYNIELFVPQWVAPIYDAYIEINIKLTQPTNYIMLHNRVDQVILDALKDSNGNIVNVVCIGEIMLEDYLIIRTEKPLQPNEGPFKLSFFVVEFLTGSKEAGIFEIPFESVLKKSKLLASRLEPISAREAYPCFDEPSIKAQYTVKIDHPNDTLAFSNAIRLNEEPIPGIDGSIQTLFAPTPPMPPYLMAFVVCDKEDFDFDTYLADNNIPIRIWARRRYIDEGYALSTLNLASKIYNSLQDIFKNVDRSALPPKIDIFAIPDYPVDGIGHFGLPIFKENKILFDKETASERDIQTIGLLIAERLSNFWFGNFITFAWWDELWLETALADYIKYRAVDNAYPEWNILQQFITEELIYALVDDAYPSTHPIYKPINNPYEIDEYFDEVEKTAAAAIFRMVEEEKNIAEMYDALTAYLNAHIWGIGDINVFYNTIGKIDKWNAKDFFDRWTKQANYPLLTIELVENIDNEQAIKVSQSRALNSYTSIFSGDLLYPSEYDFVWFVPLQCSFGTGPYNGNATHEETFYIDTKEYTRVLPTSSDGLEWVWVHCDRKFTGYYETNYTPDNWEKLGIALKLKNNEFDAEDRANIIHNLFVNAFTERTSYFQLVDVLSYLRNERDYLPWRTVYKHVNDMAEILQYKKSFIEVSGFFTSIMRDIEEVLNPWSPAGFHIEELLKETILNLACRMQDSYCLKKVAEVTSFVWDLSFSGNFTNEAFPAYLREVVFNYHMENTYDIEDWKYILANYELTDDLFLQRKLLESLTFTRLPSLLKKFIDAKVGSGLRSADFFDGMRLISINPLGREFTWDYYRENFNNLLDTYTEYDPRLGQLLIDISRSFENEFLFYELLEFIFSTPTGASGNARFKALEIVSTTNIWLEDKEEEIIQAFRDPRRSESNYLTGNSNYFTIRKKSFVDDARKRFDMYFSKVKADILRSKKI